MVSELPTSMANKANVVAEELVGRSLPGKKNQIKVPKKIHKAEREKLKRDHLNELFLDLGHALEPTRQNNGKASILGDTTRILQDLLTQVETLRRENAALVTESRYVTVEKNELRDENLALEAEIEKLQNELGERMQLNPAWSHDADTAVHPPPPAASALPIQQPPVVGPVYVIPLHQELQSHPETAAAPSPPKPSSHVRRPHARYPTPSDSWPLQILSQQHRTTLEGQHGGSSSGGSSSSSGGTNSREGGSAKE